MIGIATYALSSYGTWHWCRNCSNYPSNPTKTQSTRPTSGELCNECRGKENTGTCRT